MPCNAPKITAALLCLAVVGCDSSGSAKSVDYYKAHLDEAKATKAQCEQSYPARNDQNCVNAGIAVKMDEQRRLQQLVEREKKAQKISNESIDRLFSE